MDANKKSLGKIFDPNIRLVVPLFQRPYVWGEQKNWVPLWESICDVAERLDGGKQRSHFLGAVVFDRLATCTGDIDARQVIDGQQRLTTFQIAIAAARDLCQALGEVTFSGKFAILTNNASAMCAAPDDPFKVWPTNVDRSAYRDVMTAGSCQEVCKRFNGKLDAANVGPHNRIANAYLFFYRKLADWLGEKDSEKFGERLSSLWQTIKDDMQLVVIDLDEKDDAQVIFETLNALGTPLLPADLIKNFLFQAAENRKDKIEALYAQYWQSFDERSAFWRAEVGQGRLKRHRIDQFLQNYLTLMKGNESPASHLFAEFRDYADNNRTISPAEHLQSLHAYGSVFEKFHNGFDESSREGQFFYRLQALETTTFFPLLLEVFKSSDHYLDQEINMILTDLESFMIRRMVCGLTTKGYSKLVRSLIQKLRGSDRFSPGAIREFLLSQDAESTRWPADDEFKKNWCNRAVYSQLTRGRVRIVLEAIERALHTGKSEKIKIDADDLTIEHLMPQEWTANWPLPKDTSPEEATKRRAWLIHTFGNLTLVTAKFNAGVSNSGWQTKKQELEKYAAFALNRQLCGRHTWDDAAIEQRAGELFILAKQLWPRPISPANPVLATTTPNLAVTPLPKDRPERYDLRKKFWKGLISRPKAKNTRHADIAASKYSWIAAGSGVWGLTYNYAISQYVGRVELFIDRGAGKKEENKRMFDWLNQRKKEIEQAFGGPLSWERLDDKQSCRIAFATTGGWKDDESKWAAMQEAMIDAMARLEKALTPHMAKLKTELAAEGA